MSLKVPAISVLLPVYNAEAFLAEAIESILQQTFRDFELIIINDGSTDASSEVIKQFKDERIIIIEQHNQGLAASLNKGLKIAKGNYIARQDNDDISLPERFEKQFNFLEAHPELALLGTAAVIVDEHNKETGRVHQHPSSSAALKYFLLFDNPFVHSSVMFRRSLISQTGPYYCGQDYFEDYHLWSSMARLAAIGNLPDFLIRYREVSSGMSKTTSDYRLRVMNQAFENIRFYIKDLKDEELQTFLSVYYGFLPAPMSATSLFDKVMSKIEKEFFIKEKDLNGEIHKIQRGQYRSFRRSVFQRALDEPGLPFFKKITLKLKRRLFLFLNPDL